MVDRICPNVMNHSLCPLGYSDWHDWAEKMSASYDQVKCPGCGLYKIWVLRGINSDGLGQQRDMETTDRADSESIRLDGDGQPEIPGGSNS